ncbi:tyrosine-type recombinase/integrase [Sphingosinicella ginsenosidimutans]
MRHKSLLYVKVTRAKGRRYCYFRTGRIGENGREILARLPDLDDAGFGAAYASFLAGRTRRDALIAELTVPALIDLYERSPKYLSLSMSTKRAYGFAIAYIRKMLPTAPAGRIEQSDVARLIDARGDTPGAANMVLAVIRTIWKWGRARGHVANDPAANVAPLDIQGEHDPWPVYVLDAALKADEPITRLAVHLLYYTGQRIGDVTTIRWQDIRDNVLHIRQQKTGKRLEIRLHAALSAELARHKRGAGFIIPGSRAGQPIGTLALRQRLQRFAGKLGARIVPHGLRKNAVNALLEAGCTTAETAAITGQTMQLVEHYAKARAQSSLASAAVLKWERNV